MKTIIVSGTPGTGKTTYAKSLAKEKKYLYLDVKAFIKKNNLSDGYNKEMDTEIIDIKKLNKALLNFLDEENEKHTHGVVIDSHLSHYLPSSSVDKCIITKCHLPELKKRLSKRKYSNEKIRENLDAEIFDTCRIEALEAGHKVKVVRTDS